MKTIVYVGDYFLNSYLRLKPLFVENPWNLDLHVNHCLSRTVFYKDKFSLKTIPLYHEYKSLLWFQVHTMGSSLYHESKSIPWIQACTMCQCLCHKSKVYIMSGSQYHESRSISSGKVYLKGQGFEKVHKGLLLVNKGPRLAKDTWRSKVSKWYLKV